MPYAIFADQESIDLLDAAAEMMAAALAARSRRVDDDNVISRSVDMSRIKMATLRQQFRRAPLIEFHEFEPEERQKLFDLFAMLHADGGDQQNDAIFKAIRVLVLRSGKKEPLALGKDPWKDENLSFPKVGKCSESAI